MGKKEVVCIKVLLATGSSKLEKYIKDNTKNIKYDSATMKSHIVEKNIEQEYDVIVLSPVLPGVEDIKDIIYETQRDTDCRIVYFASTNKRQELIDIFALGVKDIITTDPIDPRVVISAIQRPGTYSDAIEAIKTKPTQTNNRWLGERIKNEPIPSEVTAETRELIKSLLRLLRQDEGETLEESLCNIEVGINNLITKKI